MINGRYVWLTKGFLGLTSPLKEEWSNYIIGLQSTSIVLSVQEDYLLWTWNNATSNRYIWKCSCELKVKKFSWFLLNKKKLTLENLKKKGWIGLSVYNLFLLEEEDISHVFLIFSFTKDVWIYVLEMLNIRGCYGAKTFEIFFMDLVL